MRLLGPSIQGRPSDIQDTTDHPSLRPRPNVTLDTFVYLVSRISYLVSCILYLVSCISYLVSCILYLVSCILYLVSCISYLVSRILYLVSCILYLDHPLRRKRVGQSLDKMQDVTKHASCILYLVSCFLCNPIRMYMSHIQVDMFDMYIRGK